LRAHTIFGQNFEEAQPTVCFNQVLYFFFFFLPPLQFHYMSYPHAYMHTTFLAHSRKPHTNHAAAAEEEEGKKKKVTALD
jgi:hypothetical protein